MRVKGPNVTPGYLGQPDTTRGGLRRGRLVPHRATRAGSRTRTIPNKGLVFDGRVVEDFKLLTGTFVSVGNLRIAALAAASPLLMDAVVCGHDRDYVGLLAWPQLGRGARDRRARRRPSCRSWCARRRWPSSCASASPRTTARNPASSTRVERVILLAEPPSLDANEITDKGYVNQRAALQRRAAYVDALFADHPGEEVILCR